MLDLWDADATLLRLLIRFNSEIEYLKTLIEKLIESDGTANRTARSRCLVDVSSNVLAIV